MSTFKQTAFTIRRFIGLESSKTGHTEKWISGLGGLAGILSVTIICQHYFELAEAAWLVASMGATAVLLFAVPHGPLSQPWAVIGGHTISAFIGVACARWFPYELLAPAVAVALSISSMHYLRCIHPPGGATALSAVIGGTQLQAMGFDYVFTPVLLNAMSLVVIAILFNALFHWRRYPAALGVRSHTSPVATEDKVEELDENDLDKALQAMNSTIDISGRELAKIYRLAQLNRKLAEPDPASLEIGQCYSNGQYGADWQVRQIVDMGSDRSSPNELLIYKVVAGAGRRQSGTISFSEFARWASYEVVLNENSWQRRSYETSLDVAAQSDHHQAEQSSTQEAYHGKAQCKTA